jgi:RNA polymerase sigma-70 factor (ECF subfamily)
MLLEGVTIREATRRSLQKRRATAMLQASAVTRVLHLWEGMASQPQPTATPDRLLVTRMAAGDERALGELYDRHSATAYALAFAMVGVAADAEEIVADAFAQVWRSAATFDADRGSVGAWLTTITRSRALDWLRTRRRRARLLEQAATSDEEGLALPVAAAGEAPDRRVEQTETRTLVGNSLAELPEPQRRVIEMAYFGGLSQSEIATELKEPLGTVKTRMRTGMRKLRDALALLRPEAQ